MDSKKQMNKTKQNENRLIDTENKEEGFGGLREEWKGTKMYKLLNKLSMGI